MGSHQTLREVTASYQIDSLIYSPYLYVPEEVLSQKVRTRMVELYLRYV